MSKIKLEPHSRKAATSKYGTRLNLNLAMIDSTTPMTTVKSTIPATKIDQLAHGYSV
jgi:hypothetical protein